MRALNRDPTVLGSNAITLGNANESLNTSNGVCDTGCDGRRATGRKMFFFEKKNQKTFATWLFISG
jgi:hypothetical protein